MSVCGMLVFVFWMFCVVEWGVLWCAVVCCGVAVVRCVRRPSCVWRAVCTVCVCAVCTECVLCGVCGRGCMIPISSKIPVVFSTFDMKMRTVDVACLFFPGFTIHAARKCEGPLAQKNFAPQT